MENITKRKRSINWEEGEKVLLKLCVEEKILVVENKNVDTNTNKAKKRAWDEIFISFNRMNSRPRELVQLQAQWRNMKNLNKKAMHEYRSQVMATGGGPPPSSPPAEVLDMVSMIPDEFKVDSNPFDSDSFKKIEKTHSENSVRMVVEVAQSEEFNEAPPIFIVKDEPTSHDDVLQRVTPQPATSRLPKTPFKRRSQILKKKKLSFTEELKQSLFDSQIKEKQVENRRKKEMHLQMMKQNEEEHNEKMSCLKLKKEILKLKKKLIEQKIKNIS